MKPFHHVNAKSVEEVIQLLKMYGGKARVIAGGTDLIPVLKAEILPEYPEIIINIKTVPNLDYVIEDAEGLKIGALTKLEEIGESPIIKGKYRLLADAANSVATPQIRNMGTIGGNICQDVRCWYYRYPHNIGGRIQCYLKGGKKCYALMGENRYHSIFGGYKGCVAVNASDIAIALVALNAKIKVAGSTGNRIIHAEEFFSSLRNILKPDEVVTEIQIPQPSSTAKQVYLKFRLREAIDFPIVSIASVIDMDGEVCKDARIVLGAIAPTPIRAEKAEQMIKGKVIDVAVAEKAADAAVEGAVPLGMNAYKVEIAKALVKRVLLS